MVSKTDIAHRRQIFRAARGKKVVLLHQHFLVDRPSRSKSWPELDAAFRAFLETVSASEAVVSRSILLCEADFPTEGGYIGDEPDQEHPAGEELAAFLSESLRGRASRMSMSRRSWESIASLPEMTPLMLGFT